MKVLKIKDNTQVKKDALSDIDILTGKIADKTLEQLEREGVFVFPEFVVDAEDITKDQMILQSILPSLIILLLLTNELDLLLLGSDTARSLGLSAKRLRVVFLALAAALAGAAVSYAGLLGFVGLVVPHIMRLLVGEESRPLMLSSLLGGAAFLTLCDLLARTLFAPYELPVGIVLAFVGGPFFIWLLLKQRGGRTHD